MDVLSDVLDTVRLTSTVFVRTRLRPPWGIGTRVLPHYAFHIVSGGPSLLEVEGIDPVEVGPGDAVVISPGRTHSIRSGHDAVVRDIREMLADGSLCADPDGPDQLVCGSFRFDGTQGGAFVATLPPLLHLRSDSPDVAPWVAGTVELLTTESSADRPGQSTVMNRLCDALFVYLLRSHLSAGPGRESSWLRALDDPQIGAALNQMHEDPFYAWSVPELATRVGMSRSAFAERFTRLVGETPIQYLIKWRVQKAAAMLRTARHSVEEIAARVGYDSVGAFSKAFKRSVGVSPGAYRRSVMS
ncbi:MAG TPA: AraC family transcriptional regulator [Micromonosporaceae bacterium]|nr:AraC family transcriptional regulator [Micromonosporaceae bacterium]